MGQAFPLVNPDRIMLASALGCLGAALSMSLPWPQVWRSVAHRQITGLSANACSLGVALSIGWIAYGLLRGDSIQVVTNTVTGGAGLTILVALMTARTDLRTGRQLLINGAGAAGVLGAAALIAASAARAEVTGPQAATRLGALLAGGAVLAAIPQPLSLLRDRSQDLSGLSPLRWRLAAGASAAWFSYGLVTAQPGLSLAAGASLTGALIVCAVLIQDTGHRPAPTAVPAPAPTPSPAAGRAPVRRARGVARVRRTTARTASGARTGPTRGVARVRPPAARLRPPADLPTMIIPTARA